MDTQQLDAPLERRRPRPRRLPLDTLIDLVREVAAEIDPRLDVVTMTDAEGGRGYVEFLIGLKDGDHEPCRITLGVDRSLGRTALRQSLEKPLRDYLARTQQQ